MRLSVTSSAADLNLDTDVEVDIEGQEAISTRWVEWRPDGTTGGKRVFEEQLDTSSPTQYKSKIRIGPGLDVHLRVASRHGIKTSFLQGKEPQRTVYLRPPKGLGMLLSYGTPDRSFEINGGTVVAYRSYVFVVHDCGKLRIPAAR